MVTGHVCTNVLFMEWADVGECVPQAFAEFQTRRLKEEKEEKRTKVSTPSHGRAEIPIRLDQETTVSSTYRSARLGRPSSRCWPSVPRSTPRPGGTKSMYAAMTTRHALFFT